MISFPGGTSVGRVMPKEEFYKRLNLSADLKALFVSDVQRITFENSLTVQTLNLGAKSELNEIIVLGMDLKNQTFDDRIIEVIARQNPHKILFWLRFEGQSQLALYVYKLYKTEWHSLEDAQLVTVGFSLDEIWSGYVEQIALRQENLSASETPIEFRLRRQDAIQKLEKNIEKLEQAARAEKQPKKKFELAMQAQQQKKELKLLISHLEAQ